MSTTQDAFQTTEFEQWAHARDLLPAERWLLQRYVGRGGSVVEGGTGGGRIVLALKALGVRHLAGFDCLPAMIDVARQRDVDGQVEFRVQDATGLDYPDAAFDHAIYLQQLLCFLESDVARRRAVGEVHRILKPGGVALFSFLCFEARARSLVGRAYLAYLRWLRRLARVRRDQQLLPWLRRGGKFNVAALWDAGPHVYWFRIPEVHELLSAQGFSICAAGFDHELARGIEHLSCTELVRQGGAGTIYVVCKK